VPILQIDRVTKDYVNEGEPVRALDGISLEVSEGDFVALVGRSGCGKSTLLNLAGAMDVPTSGRVLLDGVCTSGLVDAELTRIRRRKVGFVFQSFQLLQTLSALENVELPLLLAGARDAPTRARESLHWVEMDSLADRYPHQLSGGQMQRVAIARALVHTPRLILADEPTGNLDNTTSKLILDLLRRINAERKATIMMATHSAELAAAASSVIRLRDGRIEDTRHA
jgi:ABC-type lipoprotein export system ATPase subunit